MILLGASYHAELKAKDAMRAQLGNVTPVFCRDLPPGALRQSRTGPSRFRSRTCRQVGRLSRLADIVGREDAGGHVGQVGQWWQPKVLSPESDAA